MTDKETNTRVLCELAEWLTRKQQANEPVAPGDLNLIICDLLAAAKQLDKEAYENYYRGQQGAA